MRAMILAAGRGERLRPLTDGWAKPALPVLHEPILARVLSFLERENVREAVVNLYYAPESIREALRRQPMKIPVEFSEEKDLLGTAGGLGRAQSVFRSEDVFFLVNGDCLYDFPLAAALDSFRRSNALAMLVCTERGVGADFTPVWARENHLLAIGGENFPSEEKGAAPLTFTGIHFLRADVLSFILRVGAKDMVRDVYMPLLKRGAPLGAAFLSSSGKNFWADLGTLERFLSASRRFAGHLALTGPFIHETARVAPSASLRGFAVVEREACVEEKASLENAILMEGACLPYEASIRDAIAAPRPARPQ